ncbi:filamentous hemagglutinin outer membrane protein [Tolypothrix sp. NIES-4075]|uniref:two-partner secretion domain-containing protein n=1 Tax=Tolypothrix sp. NIES-4075 TaxID=2005459 RepID=UPI000B5CE828|nr:filamentous hemagglutinin N-terminal domain-containing protein [Tolypothrix sp. NIES-4075]GAX45031.1 filamentous hemagglutinin outer membrane protein [Tolypothrix sp. NIES-4075]
MSGISNRWGWLLVTAGLCTSVFSPNCVAQQISPDGTLPNNSNISKIGNTFNITGGTQAGSNLFHSFQQFSVPTGGTAFFNNALDIQNIISRVTGGSISNIDGLIRANGAANLFLINPSGIVFGPNASLNVGGSFLASTASSFNFADGTTFSAIAPQSTPLLTISVPIGLQFGQNPANIQVQGSILQGAPNKTLGLVGGNLSLDNSILQIPGGRVELGSVGNSGTVGLNVNGNDLSLNFPNQIGKQDVSLSNRTNVNVLAGGGGSIAINARNLNISGAGTQIRAGIAPGLGSPQTKAGNIEINATEAVIDDQSLVSNAIQANAYGQGSDIIIKTGSLKVSNGARVETSSFGQGNAGNLLIDAQGQVSFINGGFGFTSLEATGVGNGGNLQIKAGSVLVTNNSQLKASTLGRGNSGNVIIDARDTAEFTNGGFVFSQVEPGGIGNGGETRITTGSLSVTDNAILSASTLGRGDAGRINIEARDSASFNRGGAAFTTVEAQGMGNGNDLRIRARSLSVTDGSFLTANTLGRGNAGNVIIEADDVLFDRGFGFTSLEATGVGNGGNLQIQAGSVLVTNNSQLKASTLGRGNSGNVIIDARNTAEFTNGGFVFSQVEPGGIGNGGETRITTGSLSVTDGAILSASTLGRGDAGRINIEARDTASFNRGGAAFTTVEAQGTGNGNDLRIRARSLSVSNGSFLTANTLGQGNAGNVIIEADNVLFDRGTATSSVGLQNFTEAQGNGGKISISTGSLQLANQAQLLVNSFGREGNAGNININARDTVSLSDQSEIFSQLGGGITGAAGNIDISAGSLQVKNGSIISSESFGQGNGGNITIKARDAVSFLTEAGAFSSVRFGAIGNAGDINITAGSFSTADGSFLAASTLGRGISGNIQITATDSISLEGVDRSGFAGGIYSEVATAEPSRGGNINIKTRSLTVKNGARLATDTNGRGDAGSININATDFVTFDGIGSNQRISGAYSLVLPGGIGNADDINITTKNLSLSNGAILTAGTLGQGNAGTININAADSVTISGTGSNRSNTFIDANTQIPGEIGVTSSNVSGILVQSESAGRAGDIIVTSPKINLDNQGGLIAKSQSGNGGNINLQVGDLLLLRRGSQISTNAGTAQQGGDGGNITINSPSGFIVAVPNENSDISANAFRGQGGKVDITTSGIYGIESRPRITELSDITASSELGVQGSIQINNLNVDPNRGLLQLPALIVNTPRLVDSSCAAFDKNGSTFLVTGRGGLPPSPDDFLSSDVVWTDSRLIATTAQQSRTSAAKLSIPKAVEIVPATGWVFNGKGEVTLISSAPEATASVSVPTCAKQ